MMGCVPPSHIFMLTSIIVNSDSDGQGGSFSNSNLITAPISGSTWFPPWMKVVRNMWNSNQSQSRLTNGNKVGQASTETIYVIQVEFKITGFAVNRPCLSDFCVLRYPHGQNYSIGRVSVQKTRVDICNESDRSSLLFITENRMICLREGNGQSRLKWPILLDHSAI